MTFVSKIGRFLLDFVFPKVCFGCRREGTFLCTSCFFQIQPSSEILFLPHLDEIFVCCKNSELLRAILHAFKYGFIEEFANSLGLFFHQRLAKEDFSDFHVVPVPLHWRRLNDRGFNQAEILARALPFSMADILQRHRFTTPQVELHREERLQNVRGAFSLKKGVAVPSSVLLIDDVYTTGATLQECAKVLRESGVRKIFCVVLSHGV